MFTLYKEMEPWYGFLLIWGSIGPRKEENMLEKKRVSRRMRAVVIASVAFVLLFGLHVGVKAAESCVTTEGSVLDGVEVATYGMIDIDGDGFTNIGDIMCEIEVSLMGDAGPPVCLKQDHPTGGDFDCDGAVNVVDVQYHMMVTMLLFLADDTNVEGVPELLGSIAANLLATDIDGDLVHNACDWDMDGDGVCNVEDPCVDDPEDDCLPSCSLFYHDGDDPDPQGSFMFGSGITAYVWDLTAEDGPEAIFVCYDGKLYPLIDNPSTCWAVYQHAFNTVSSGTHFNFYKNGWGMVTDTQGNLVWEVSGCDPVADGLQPCVQQSDCDDADPCTKNFCSFEAGKFCVSYPAANEGEFCCATDGHCENKFADEGLLQCVANQCELCDPGTNEGCLPTQTCQEQSDPFAVGFSPFCGD